jgi:O-antigen/teichoic acid export membrane protein
MAATASVLALVALQLITRVSSFALSIALARGLGARFYGLANVQLRSSRSS